MQREVRQASGLFLALLALVVQLTLAAAAVPATTVALADVTTLCHHDGNPSAPKAPAHQIPDCQLCIVCHGATGPAALLTPAPMVPEPTAIRTARAVVLPPATAPPPRFVTAARPRGPPIPV